MGKNRKVERRIDGKGPVTERSIATGMAVGHS